MSLMLSKEHAKPDIELENMLKEIQQSLSTHLTNILTPIFNEKKDIHNILLNVPMIKKMHIENIELKSMNKLLSDEIHKLKEELSKYQNIRLQVKEINNPEEKSLNIELDVAKKNKKMESQHSGIKLASLNNLDYFNNMISDEEPDTDDEKYETKTVPNSDRWLSSLNKKQTDDVKGSDLFLGSDDKGVAWTKNVTVTKEDEEEVVDSDEEIIAEDYYEDDEDDVDVDDEDVDEEEDDEDMEVEDIEINGNLYVTTGTENGVIYKVDSDGEILEDEEGEFVKAGYYKDGVSFLSKE